MNNILFYPTINSKMLDEMKLNQEDNFKFYFNDVNRNIIREIIVEDINNDKIVLKDKNNVWFVDQHNLIVERRVRFDTTKLFGSGGVTPKNSILGISIKYTSSKSGHRGVKEIIDFNNNQGFIDINTKFEFLKGDINDDIQYSIIIYLKDIVGEVSPSEKHFNLVKGTILGVVDNKSFTFRGDGSFFKTIKINDKNSPLWYLRTDFEPSLYVRDSIELIINEGHKDYGLFDPLDKRYNEDFIMEVTINIVVMIISRGFELINEIQSTEYEEGMIGHLIKYYIKVFDLNSTNIEDIHRIVNKEIRK